MNWLLGWQRYPPPVDNNRRVGFKSTEHFIFLEQEGQLPKIPGEKLVLDETKPFTILKSFQPEINSTLMLFNHPESALLRDITIIGAQISFCLLLINISLKFLKRTFPQNCLFGNREDENEDDAETCLVAPPPPQSCKKC